MPADGRQARQRRPGGEAIGRRPGQLPAGRHKLSREFVVSSQQTRIIDALANIVAEKGYAATSVGDVLARAGVSRATFYEHYRSKEDCFLIAFRAIAAGLIRRVEDDYRGDEEWSERVSRALSRFLAVLAGEPALARMCMVESLSVGPEGIAIYRETVDRFELLFRDGREHSDRPEQIPPHLPRAVASGISGLVYREIMAGHTADLPSLLPELLYFALTPYIGRDRAYTAVEAAKASAAGS